MGQRALAKAVYCPKCNAAPGRACVNWEGEERTACHRERHRRAKEYRQSQKPKRPPAQEYLDQVEWAKMRARVFATKGHKCHYCGEDAWQVDHFIPRAHGGTDDMDNLFPCCGPCNASKGTKLYEVRDE